ncbi:MAG TPA: YwiC-like family protein [Actinomycetota bacterium]|nr:YwiC-like family protein [Actinomycetota bacterium]
MASTPELRLVPKEHGASFMSVHSLLLGIVAGLAAGGDDWAGLLLALAFGALFLPLTAAVSVITQPRLARAARRRATVLGAAFVAAGALALVHGPVPELVWLGAIGIGLGGLYAASRARTGGRSVPSQLSAIASIALLAPLAWLLVAGPTERWPLSAPTAFLAFGGTVPYVRERVRRRRFASMSVTERLRGGAVALVWQGVALAGAVSLAIAGVVHPLVPIAFAPGATKVILAIGRPETKPPIRRIGYLETAISTAFAVLAGIGLGISP